MKFKVIKFWKTMNKNKIKLRIFKNKQMFPQMNIVL